MKFKFLFNHLSLFSRLCFLMFAISMASISFSAEPETEKELGDNAEVTTELDTQETQTSADEDEAASAPTEDRFVPSTQISEDLSVSFPVNI